MIQTALNILADLGTATFHSLWVPMLVWTLLALPLWRLLVWTDRLHPYAEYRLAQVLLAALPIGIAAVSVVGLFPSAPRSTVLSAQSVVALPQVETTTGLTTGVSWSWMHGVGLLTISAVGAGLLRLGQFVLNVIAVERVRRRLTTVHHTPSLRLEIDRLKNTLSVRRSVQLCSSSDAVVPMTLCGLRPVILVPNRLVETPRELRVTLRHELIHVRRWDDWAHVLERLLSALFAIHPLVERLRRSITNARERACDAAVLEDGTTSAGSYARLLATFADGTSPRPLGTLSLSESSSSLKDRLSAMHSSVSTLLSSRLALGSALITLGFALTFGVVACSDGISPPSSSSEAPTSEESAPSSTAENGEVYMVVEEQPDLVGGMKALQEAVHYPTLAKEAGIEGRVIVQFVVDEEGNVTNPTITRGVHESLNEAAIEAVKAQTFKPGKQRGEPVKVQMSLPVTFRLPGESSAPSSERSTSEPQRNSATAGLEAVTVGDDVPPPDRETRLRLHRTISYPKLAQKAGIEGPVRVRFTVNEEGRATNPRVVNEQAGLDSAHDLLVESALHAVKSVTFTPTYEETGLTGHEIEIQFRFQLPDE